MRKLGAGKQLLELKLSGQFIYIKNERYAYGGQPCPKILVLPN